MKKNLIIFDFDGVISDSIGITFEILKELIEKYNVNIEPTKENFIESSKKSQSELRKELNISFIKMIIMIFDAKRILKKRENEFNVFPGMKDVLKKLSKKNNLAIVTTYRGNIKRVLRKQGIEGYFDLVYKVKSREKKSEKIEKCIDLLNGDREKTFFITDDLEDIPEAKEVGVKSITVTWGIHTKKELFKEKPDFIINKPNEILRIVS